jgi:HSP20 family protein
MKEGLAMNLIRKNNNPVWDPFSVFDEMDHFLAGGAAHFVPAVDVREEDDQYIVKTDLPGISKDGLDVTIQNNVLTIRGERKEQHEKKEKGYWHSERWSGSFHRSLELPAEVDASKVSASFKDGVLELRIPKPEQAKPRQIKVDVK